MYFQYGETEIEYLKSKDKKLAEIIEKIGHIDRKVDKDLFSSVIYNIVGQQISTKAHATVWKRLLDELGEVNATTICEADIEKLQSFGMTYRKAEYSKDFAGKVQEGTLELEGIWEKSDEEVMKELSSLKGIGKWTAEMLLLFCMERPNILSYDDLAIQRGLRMVYHHRKIDKKLFEKYRRRYHPYASVASLYLWAVAGGVIADMKDYAPKKVR